MPDFYRCRLVNQFREFVCPWHVFKADAALNQFDQIVSGQGLQPDEVIHLATVGQIEPLRRLPKFSSLLIEFWLVVPVLYWPNGKIFEANKKIGAIGEIRGGFVSRWE